MNGSQEANHKVLLFLNLVRFYHIYDNEFTTVDSMKPVLVYMLTNQLLQRLYESSLTSTSSCKDGDDIILRLDLLGWIIFSIFHPLFDDSANLVNLPLVYQCFLIAYQTIFLHLLHVDEGRLSSVIHKLLSF